MIETAKNTPFPRNDIKPLTLQSILVDEMSCLWQNVLKESFDPFNKWSLRTSALHFLKGLVHTPVKWIGWLFSSAFDLRVRQIVSGVIDFEKEDDDIMKFITSAAILRAEIFAKPAETFIQSQSMTLISFFILNASQFVWETLHPHLERPMLWSLVFKFWSSSSICQPQLNSNLLKWVKLFAHDLTIFVF
jgi:hypothetical protein